MFVKPLLAEMKKYRFPPKASVSGAATGLRLTPCATARGWTEVPRLERSFTSG